MNVAVRVLLLVDVLSGKKRFVPNAKAVAGLLLVQRQHLTFNPTRRNEKVEMRYVEATASLLTGRESNTINLIILWPRGVALATRNVLRI